MSEVTSYLVGQTVDLGLALVPPGSVLPPGGSPVWAVDNAAIGTITPSADGSTAKLLGIAPGTVNVSFSDSPLDPTLAITFAPVVATSATITAALDPASAA